MKITGIRATTVTVPLEAPLRHSNVTPSYIVRWPATLTIAILVVLSGTRCCPTQISPIRRTVLRPTFAHAKGRGP